MASLDEARDDYADENPPVLLLLGLVSALRRLEPLLPMLEPRPASTEPTTGDGATATAPGRFLYLVLGLIAFRHHLLSVLPRPHEAGTPDAPRSTCVRAETPAARMPGPRELLR